jgi:hypothetical protein
MKNCSMLDRVRYEAECPGFAPEGGSEGPVKLVKLLRSKLVKTTLDNNCPRPACLAELQTCPVLNPYQWASAGH